MVVGSFGDIRQGPGRTRVNGERVISEKCICNEQDAMQVISHLQKDAKSWKQLAAFADSESLEDQGLINKLKSKWRR